MDEVLGTQIPEAQALEALGIKEVEEAGFVPSSSFNTNTRLFFRT
jgi:hypothetical protein